MADILIRGMEMPKDCGKCFVGDRTICADACPLVELPPHGRLIDADEAYDALLNRMVMTGYQSRAINCIEGCETIIPADMNWMMQNCCCLSGEEESE